VIRVVLSLGSNISWEYNIHQAVTSIMRLYGELEISPVYETSSIGFDGPAFINLVLGLYSTKSVEVIRAQLREMEAEAGRVRGRKSFSDRVIDIDIILFGDCNLRKHGYNIPRDEIERYAYVLKPLSDLYPDLVHPITGLTIKQMWCGFKPGNQTLTMTDFSL